MATLLYDFIAITLGGSLLLAGLLKLTHRSDLRNLLDTVAPWLPVALRGGISRSLPWLELTLGLACLVPWSSRFIWPAVCVLCFIFLTVSLVIALSRTEVRCQCFGRYFSVGRWYGVLRSALLLAGAVGLALTAPPDLAAHQRLATLGLAILFAVSLFLYLAILHEARDLRS